MNKSLATHLIASGFIAAGIASSGQAKDILLAIGLFALAGGITNWLAIHMLFEKIPGLYGSGVVITRFEEFKSGLHHLMMTQFFNQQNLDRFFANMKIQNEHRSLDFSQIIEKTDLTPAFESLVNTVLDSSLGGMLAMVGGKSAMTSLKGPFILKMKKALNEVAHSASFQDNVKAKLSRATTSSDLFQQLEKIVNARIDELTPSMVKDMVQEMIREHLGWLVVWGGVFGGAIGLISSQISF